MKNILIAALLFCAFTARAQVVAEHEFGKITVAETEALDTAAHILVRENSTGIIKTRSASSITGWPLTGSTALTGTVGMTLDGNTLSLINNSGSYDFAPGSTSFEIGDFETTWGGNGVSHTVDDASLPPSAYLWSNTNATTGAMRIELRTAGSGDSDIQLNVNGGAVEWTMGIDNSDGDALVISAGTALGTGNVIKFTTGGDILTPSLPTDCTGKATGTWWNDSGTLKLCP